MKEKSGAWSCKAEGSQLTQDLVFFEFLAEAAIFQPFCYSYWLLPFPNYVVLNFANLEYVIVSVENHFPSFTFVTFTLH